MAKTWKRAPTPCVGVCKFKEGGLCVGCSMNKGEKKASKRIKRKSQKRAFFKLIITRLESLGRLNYWARMYRKKCERNDASCPLDKLGVEATCQRQSELVDAR